MINFILVSHGELAAGLMNAVELIIGTQDDVELISLQEGDSIEELGHRIERAISALLPGSEGIIILVDLFGASPFNQAAIEASKHDNIEVISGINLPMLLEVLLMKESLSFSELIKHARQSGINSIKVLSEIIAQ